MTSEHCSLLFQFVVIRGPRDSVECSAVKRRNNKVEVLLSAMLLRYSKEQFESSYTSQFVLLIRECYDKAEYGALAE